MNLLLLQLFRDNIFWLVPTVTWHSMLHVCCCCVFIIERHLVLQVRVEYAKFFWSKPQIHDAGCRKEWNCINYKTQNFTTPFYYHNSQIWICIAISVLAVTPILNYLHRLSPFYEYNNIKHSGGLSHPINCFWYIYGALLQQGRDLFKKHKNGLSWLKLSPKFE